MHMSKHHTKVQIWIPDLSIIQIPTVEQNYFVKYSDQIYKDELVSSTNLKTGHWFPDICISVVLTIVSDLHFYHFPTVEPMPTE